MKRFFGLAALVLAAFTFTLASCKTSTDDDSTASPTEQSGDPSAQGGDNQNGQDPITFTSVNLSSIASAYTARHGEALTGTLGENVQISIADGATVKLNDMSINADGARTGNYAGITCEGNATIVLSGTNTVKAIGSNAPGIYVPEGKTLTIRGEGSLTASGRDDENGAGIGGGNGLSCGNIVIEGGTITATAYYWSAGIGGGRDAACGNITISGGTVTAQCEQCAAGIGSGYAASANASCGNITISGGTVNATGGTGSAGIGTGDSSENNSCGNITISGGTVNATGGSNSAGIGTGYGNNNNNSCGDIEITTGVTSVTATKGEGAQHSIGQGGASCGIGTVTIGDEEGAKVAPTYTYQP